MLNRINQLFQDSPKNLLSIYFCAGCPTLDGTADVIRALERNGVSMIEIGIPFSDPMADGIVIQNAATRALHNGMSLRLLFEQLRDIRRDVRIPLILMGYLNPIMQFGFEAFCQKCVSNKEAGTGVTVIYFPDGATAGCDISGGGPASRETPLTMPMTADNPINAIVLSGGSAYGLAASDGVMTCLEEHGIGYNTGVSLVPLVCQSCIFDLGYGSSKVRPDSTMGYEACIQALMKAGVVNTDASTAANSNSSEPIQGCIGAGTGATVGKIMGMKQAEKSGLGIYSVKTGTFTMTAIVVVNALGDISDYETGKKLAGLKNADRTEYVSCEEALYQFMAPRDMFTGNTTIGAVITNAAFNKAELNKIASMARNAYARCINPVGTMADGDTIYAASTAKRGDSEAVHVDINFAGTLAARVMSAAIKNAVMNSKISDEEFLSMVK